MIVCIFKPDLCDNEMVDPLFDYQFRLILVGDSTVGKSSLLKYFTDGYFSHLNDPTVGVDFYARLIEVRPGVKVKLQIWDTAGQERFRSITRSYYRNSVGGLLVYDVSSRRTFESVADWLFEARHHTAVHGGVFMLVGHKSDLSERRGVSVGEAREFASRHGLRYIETSAKTGENVEEAFLVLAKEVYHLIEEGSLSVEEGWDGIKLGYSHKPGAFHRPRIETGEVERGNCC